MTDEETIQQAADEYGKEHEPSDGMWIALCEAFKAGVEWRDQDILTPEEAKVALETIDNIAAFVAMRGLWTEQVPSLVKLCNYLRERSK